jgi:alpha-galactosidase
MKVPVCAILILNSITFSSVMSQIPTNSATPIEGAQAMILTPPASDTPRVNGPNVFGVRPGSPFLYRIPATGKRPMEFAADGLPSGLKLDAATGQITGVLKETGEHIATFRARNASGSAEKKFRIVIGDKIALTPPMGWNSWNCWGGAVSQEKVLSSARAMVAKGLRDHGWTYINIDDGWQGVRGGEHSAIQPNSRFPDMKALGEEIHALGLKFGIYSTPWRGTYEGHIGSSSDHEDGTCDWIKAGDHNEFYRFGKDEKTQGEKKKINWCFGKFSFADKDASQWGGWGVDYLKYDWFPNDVPHTEEMAKALRKSGRDVVYSLSNTALYDLAPDYARLANAWRTTGDITDTWQSMGRIGFAQDRWAGYTGPGHWSDPDMLVVGHVGWGPHLHPTRLTPDEQYTHISLWCLLSAPLLIGCDIAQIDDFTLSLLTNDEVLEINLDSLGKPATQVSNEGDKVIYARTLDDGSIAVGLFNRGAIETTIAVHWSPWGELTTISGRQVVRDLWRQKDLGTFDGNFETKVAPHGVVLVRLSPKR